MQVQSASDPPKKLALGERAIMADGIEYSCSSSRRSGQPVELVYPTEGTPLIIGPNGDLQERAEPERRAAVPELHASRAECQQLIIDVGGLRSAACADQGEAGPQAVQGDQDHEGRRGRGREAERRDQEALQRSCSRCSDGRRFSAGIDIETRSRPMTEDDNDLTRRDVLKGSARALAATRVRRAGRARRLPAAGARSRRR